MIGFADGGVTTYQLDDDSSWDQDAANTTFKGSGVVTGILTGGLNYNGGNAGSGKSDYTTAGAVTVNNIDTMTENIVGYYAPITSTTYGVFDSGYKYMFDRFNNTFRYVPLNGDIAGTCARTDIEQFPWFSPAGTARGSILNSVKLVYNPGKKQRDILSVSYTHLRAHET